MIHLPIIDNKDNRTDHLWRQLLICPQGRHVRQVRLCPAQLQSSLLYRWQEGMVPSRVGPWNHILQLNKGYFLKSVTGEACVQIILFIHSSTHLGLGIWPGDKDTLNQVLENISNWGNYKLMYMLRIWEPRRGVLVQPKGGMDGWERLFGRSCRRMDRKYRGNSGGWGSSRCKVPAGREILNPWDLITGNTCWTLITDLSTLFFLFFEFFAF